MQLLTFFIIIISLVNGQNSVVDVQVQVDNVNPLLSQSQFQAALPPNVSVVSYNDANASVVIANCMPGFWCAAGSAVPTPCAAGTYQPYANQVSVDACLECPAGSYCFQNSSVPTPCAAGSYLGVSGGENQGNCSICSAGNYCPLGASAQTPCAVGSFAIAPEGRSQASCSVCPAGTYDPTTLGRTTECPACAANSYCLSALSQAPCPANTVSQAGATSQLQCTCVSGYSCTYTKRIAATVMLNNTSLDAFNADTDGVRTKFIAAMAAAAGVLPAQVTIISAQAHMAARMRMMMRRLFGVAESGGSGNIIHVTAVIEGAVALHHHLLVPHKSLAVVSMRAIHQVQALALI